MLCNNADAHNSSLGYLWFAELYEVVSLTNSGTEYWLSLLNTRFFNFQNHVTRQDIVSVLILQGTTGHPKGVTLTHHNLVNNAVLVGENMNFQEVREEIVFFSNWRVKRWEACSVIRHKIMRQLRRYFRPHQTIPTLSILVTREKILPVMYPTEAVARKSLKKFRLKLVSNPWPLRFSCRGPFLQSPDNFSGRKSNIQIEIKRIRGRARVLASKILHFVSLTDSFIMLDVKLLKLLSCM